ncbi:Sua5/YciO/YrdC/YwlC family protein [Marinimicrobium alkaliphilum]|uniref:Sua5/YciO/YrdC/YwlC family protein n=1 Tax=Marinimicrobium alkaliphilum TaxID=2202654 RepID=UPI000DB9319F|nr:Sua5/YciO/YrdC/YwlC family protein [Marinimicrobium alkaliphilum]
MTLWDRHPRIHCAARLLHRGAVVGYPTEAVWGLGCNPWNRLAVEQVLRLKARPEHKGLILLASDIHQLTPLLQSLNGEQRERLAGSWPGPVTWLIPNHGWAPPWVTGRFSAVAVRVTDHPVAAALSRAFGGPIVSTSANPQALPPARTAVGVRRYFGRGLDAVLPGTVGTRTKPSEIRDLITGERVRAG